MLKRIFIGLLFVLMGLGLVYYSGNLNNMFGTWKWAEDYLGGTKQGYSIVGFLLIVFGFMFLFGVIE